MEIISPGDDMLHNFMKRKPDTTANRDDTNQDTQTKCLDKVLDNNILLFHNIFKNDETIIYREFQNKWLKAAQCCIIYVDGMVKEEIISKSIIEPILDHGLTEEIQRENMLEELKKKVLVSINVTIKNLF